jgi:hypothetical protein
MFDESDSRGGSDGLKPLHGRHYSEQVSHRPLPFDRDRRPREEEHPPFVIGDNGLLKVLPASTAVNGPSATTLNTSIQSGILSELPAPQEGPYRDEHPAEPSPTRHQNLRHAKLPHRDARAAKRNSFAERAAAYPLDENPTASPERSPEDGDGFEKAKRDEIAREDRARELQHKRSTIFENLTPVEEPTWTTQAAVRAQTSDAGTEERKEALQRTPRASRQPLAVQNNLLRDSSLARSSSRRLQKASKKRPRSLDYDDAELSKMSYSELRMQNFDFDPQTASMQAAVVPSGDSIESKLKYYKGQDSIAQHQFFTQLSVQDWELSGDWFLDEFSKVVQKMKNARQAKRRMIERFEGEISAREEAVRGKTEGIGRTLQELKQEGQNMMQGKDVDL